MRFRLMSVALIAIGLAGFSTRASAILITLPITGGPGLDQGEMCPSGSLCPGTTAFSLSGSAAVTGSLVYDNVANTVDFSVTLAAPAVFAGAPFPTILAGGSFSALGVPVMSIPLGGGAFEIVQVGPATSTALVATPPFIPVATTPAVSGLTCVVNTGADQCGFSLGPGGFTLTDGFGSFFDVFATINVNVPEPATIAIVGAGLLGLLVAGRRLTA